MEELSEFLQEPVILVESLKECLVDDDAFSCLIRSSPPQGRAFQLSWEGILGMEPIDGKPHASVSLFLYSRNRRLALSGHAEGSVLEIVYEGSLEHGGRWANPCWDQDEFGEYLTFETYGEC
ncbi:hypothetical protein [Streptomyces xantholiticus]|uniref:hypothetical protein n=1 Tax=Streptomyces xantholiticus TaxID=68285 RepID=UPI00167871AD|nr:hypothetical protein [Streptomyces xantholiticus]GGW68819.1 hypothetical protein GCM10010381_62170 [Streptomyces xantholiticus]